MREDIQEKKRKVEIQGLQKRLDKFKTLTPN